MTQWTTPGEKLKMGKFETIFDRVYSKVNETRSKTKRSTLDWQELKGIVVDLGFAMDDWYTALARAKKMTPNMAELFYKAFGREVPPPRGTARPALVELAAEPEPEAEPDAEPEETEPEEVNVASVLASVIGWLDLLPISERHRVIMTVDVYYAGEVTQK